MDRDFETLTWARRPIAWTGRTFGVLGVTGLFIGMVLQFFSTGCGSSSNQSSTTLLTATSDSGLALCTASSYGQIAYVTDSKVVKACTADGWVSLKGDTGAAGATGSTGSTGATGTSGTGFSITSRYRYHVDTYSGSTDFASETASLEVYLGTAELLKFSDGSSLVTAQGAVFNTIGTARFFEWSLVRLLSSSSTAQTMVSKFDTYANMRSRFSINTSTSGSTITLGATIDDDGSFTDNTDSSFVLTLQ